MDSLDQIKKILNFVLNNPHSDFYKKKYAAINISDFDIHKFANLPLLTRAEIAQSDPETRLFVEKSAISATKVSSGTSGKKPLIIFMDQVDQQTKQIHFQILKKNKISRMFYLLSGYQSYLRWYVYGSTHQKDFYLTVGDINNLTLSAQICSSIGADAIETTSTLLYLFTPMLSQVYDIKKIRYISLSAEPTSRLKMEYFRQMYPKAYFNFYYGSAETNPLGYRCEYLSKLEPRFFHPFPNFYLESIKKELVVTSLKSSAFPLIRYKTGNQTKVSNRICKCGVNLTFELLGRKEADFIKIHGTMIHPQLIEEALSFVADQIQPAYQMHIFERSLQGKLLPELELKLISKGAHQSTNLTKHVSDNLFLSAHSTLTNLVEKGIFLPLKITFVKKIPSKTKQALIINHIR